MNSSHPFRRAQFTLTPRAALWTVLAQVALALATAGPVVARELAQAPGPKYDPAPFAAVLRQHVDTRGLVDYAGLHAEPGALAAYLVSVAELPRSEYEAWSEPDRIAFWLNVYNAYTLKAIVDHYPIRASLLRRFVYPANSIRQIPGVWDTLTWPVMGEEVTLDHIEHGILRVEFDEPRIHAALVCAAMGCPPLRSEPYRGEHLEQQLDDQMRRFVTDPRHVQIDPERGIVSLSSIFRWYGEDFVPRYGNGEHFDGFDAVERAVMNAILPFFDAENQAYLTSKPFRIRYLNYDWALNEQSTDA